MTQHVIALTGLLAAAIDVERVDRIVLKVWCRLAPVEDIIGRKMNERRRRFTAYLRNICRSGAIDRPGHFDLAFGAVDRGVGREIDDEVRLVPLNDRADGAQIGDTAR